MLTNQTCLRTAKTGRITVKKQDSGLHHFYYSLKARVFSRFYNIPPNKQKQGLIMLLIQTENTYMIIINIKFSIRIIVDLKING